MACFNILLRMTPDGLNHEPSTLPHTYLLRMRCTAQTLLFPGTKGFGLRIACVSLPCRDTLMRELYDHLAGPNRGEAVSVAELCDLISEWVGMDLSEGEVLTVVDMMDLDQDGAVSMDDFMVRVTCVGC